MSEFKEHVRSLSVLVRVLMKDRREKANNSSVNAIA